MDDVFDFVEYRLCLSDRLTLLAYRRLGGVVVAVFEGGAAYAFRGYFEVARCGVSKWPVDAPAPPIPASDP